MQYLALNPKSQLLSGSSPTTRLSLFPLISPLLPVISPNLLNPVPSPFPSNRLPLPFILQLALLLLIHFNDPLSLTVFIPPLIPPFRYPLALVLIILHLPLPSLLTLDALLPGEFFPLRLLFLLRQGLFPR